MDEKEYDKIEEKLLKDELKKQKKPMPVSGKGVFILKRIIEGRKNKKL